MPPARCFHSATAIDDKVYVFGGTDGKSRRFNDLAILDTTSWLWSRPVLGGSAPLARSHHTTTFLGTSIFVFGGSAGYGKGCLSDFVRLEFDGLSSWAGPNIERLAIEHTVMKEQFGNLAADAETQRREAVRDKGCMDSEIEAAYKQLAGERSALESVRHELDDATAETVALKEQLDLTLQEHVAAEQELESTRSELHLLKLRVGCFEEQIMQEHISVRDSKHRALTLEAQLQVVTDEKLRLEQVVAQQQAEAVQLRNERQRAADQADEARGDQKHWERDSSQCKKDLEAASGRMEAAEAARSKAEKSLEDTMAQLQRAQSEHTAVYERSRREFTEATSRYNDELASLHSARSGLESSLDSVQRENVRLQARVAEQSAVASVAGSNQTQMEARVQHAEAEHRRAELALIECKQMLGQHEGVRTQLDSQLATVQQELSSVRSELAHSQSEHRSCKEQQQEVLRRADKFEVCATAFEVGVDSGCRRNYK